MSGSPTSPSLGRVRSTSPQQETRPLHTSEIGSLKKLPDHGTEWLGSSSGVYFVNTVRRAFNAAFLNHSESEFGPVSSADRDFPAAEDLLAGRDTPDVANEQVEGRGGTSIENEVEALLYNSLGELPMREVGMELATIFFRSWHPLFPFLHGPTFLSDMDGLYSQPSSDKIKFGGGSKPQALRPTHEHILKHTTFLLILNIAALSRPSLLPLSSRITSPLTVSRLAGLLSISHSIPTIQTLLAAELFLISTISLRAASTVAGMVLRAIFQTGLHRCPLRYAQLSPSDCELRKRIFWSAYALDRHLSQSLGDPITLQDSDIDVCLSGRELHAPVPVTSSGPMMHGSVLGMHLPMTSETTTTRTRADVKGESLSKNSDESTTKSRREAALTAYVQYSRLTGRVIELFHKSIHARFPARDEIVYLTSDVETWWNELPDFLSSDPQDLSSTTSPSSPQPPHNQTKLSSHHRDGNHDDLSLSPFFNLLYAQLTLLLHRPSLSLPPTSAQFTHGLSVCVRAARTTLSALRAHRARKQSLHLPSLLSAAWMAGLILAFACLLGKYPQGRAVVDIAGLRGFLVEMDNTTTTAATATNAAAKGKRSKKGGGGSTARRCAAVLGSLEVDIRGRRANGEGYLGVYRLVDEGSGDAGSGRTASRDESEPAARNKRRKMNGVEKRKLSVEESDNNLQEGSAPPLRAPPPPPSSVPLRGISSRRRSIRQGATGDLDKSDPNMSFANPDFGFSPSSAATTTLPENFVDPSSASSSSPKNAAAFQNQISTNANSNSDPNWTSSLNNFDTLADLDPSDPTLFDGTGMPFSFGSVMGLNDQPMPTTATAPAVNEDIWSGSNFNMADVFRSATWENLIGANLMPWEMTDVSMPVWEEK